MSSDSKLLMLGLKGSGKTTYLAALWHLLEAGEIPSELDIPQLQPNRDYLNRVRNSWLSLKPVGRTTGRSTADISMSLRNRASGTNIEISLPDLSGESFRLQWARRKVPKSYLTYAEDCTGAFLFIHPNEIQKTSAIRPTADQPATENKGTKPIKSSKNWTPEQSSTQVQLVDILQILLQLRNERSPLRLAVIISAWDLVRSKIPPSIWLDGRLPLLSQFVKANPDRIVADVFGISAQGGDLSADLAALEKIAVPATRCIAVRGVTLEPVSIGAPLSFLVSENDEARAA
jgi:hypothetical protein